MYNTPLLDLVYSAATVHRMHNDPSMVGGGDGRVLTMHRLRPPDRPWE